LSAFEPWRDVGVEFLHQGVEVPAVVGPQPALDPRLKFSTFSRDIGYS
jgi:hypothetical protein